jgi:hypothetical protein
VSTSETQAEIQKQIQGEKAGALQRAMEALEAALGQLARHDATGGPASVRRELVSAAGERLWYVVIQREAMGILRHEVLHDVLAIPPDVRRSMGPARRRRAS